MINFCLILGITDGKGNDHQICSANHHIENERWEELIKKVEECGKDIANELRLCGSADGLFEKTSKR